MCAGRDLEAELAEVALEAEIAERTFFTPASASSSILPSHIADNTLLSGSPRTLVQRSTFPASVPITWFEVKSTTTKNEPLPLMPA